MGNENSRSNIVEEGVNHLNCLQARNYHQWMEVNMPKKRKAEHPNDPDWWDRMKKRQVHHPQTMTHRKFMGEEETSQKISKFVGLRPTETPATINFSGQQSQRVGRVSSSSISPTSSSYRFSIRLPEADGNEPDQRNSRHSMFEDASASLRRSSSSVDLPVSSLDGDRRSTFAFDVPAFVGTSSSADSRLDQSMSLYTSNGQNISRSHKSRNARPHPRSLADITNMPSPSKKSDKGPLWYSSTITISDANAAEWSKTKKSMLEEAVAAALDLPIEDVQATDELRDMLLQAGMSLKTSQFVGTQHVPTDPAEEQLAFPSTDPRDLNSQLSSSQYRNGYSLRQKLLEANMQNSDEFASLFSSRSSMNGIL
ncbi:hypothetical protein GUITHDRAFT_109764 [Guillardia theta CCMP2712]|uniref:Uncharacterized protein n=1 Tax=Guillardia theta (strain CCMP2712) TaxID=905079 RepID=L1J895_GUITC|nr:hypothetical protein GUITHDRAFT_109764 [Guillardia theta CCMP2712]EKX44309.1 hypothetical protein GUITHDRAFT_109764 [Guillardia theta CCMP2712]|eukprot:XP_005831289.1 hypothetical protein GUITHDRAFT_109764 [Guillardia theta CCMP2712]